MHFSLENQRKDEILLRNSELLENKLRETPPTHRELLKSYENVEETQNPKIKKLQGKLKAAAQEVKKSKIRKDKVCIHCLNTQRRLFFLYFFFL